MANRKPPAKSTIDRALVRDVMTTHPLQLAHSATVSDEAQAMRDRDVGAILVTENGTLCGLVTDRDVVVRGIADGHDPNHIRLAEICSRELTALSPEDTLSDAVRLMRERAIRRLPVVENGGTPVGILSLGDLALRLDPQSVLGDISGAPPNA